MKRFFLGLLFISFAVKAQIPATGLAGYWPMDGNANDYSGNGNNGAVNGATLTCDRCGNPARAYGFNGINANIIVNNSPSIDMNNSSDFSVALWLKVYSNPNTDGIPLSKNRWGYWSSYQFFTNCTNPGYCTASGHASFYAAAGAMQDACSDNAVCLGPNIANGEADNCYNGWIFLVGTYDAALAKSYFYINGVLQSDIGGISGTLSNSVNLAFGSHPANTDYFKGALDDIRIYKAKLTQSEINALYAEDCTATGINESQLLAQANVFPNPATEKLNIVFPVQKGLSDLSVKVYDLLGKEVLQAAPGPENMNKVELNTSALPQGIYFAHILSGRGTQVVKFEKAAN